MFFQLEVENTKGFFYSCVGNRGQGAKLFAAVMPSAYPIYLNVHGFRLHTDTFLDRKIHTLSGGQRQRVGLARCLITQPNVLIADEPTSMLDSSSKANLNRLLKTSQNISGFSMLVVTHDLPSALKISDRIYLLRDGVLKELERALPPEKIAELMYNVAAH